MAIWNRSKQGKNTDSDLIDSIREEERIKAEKELRDFYWDKSPALESSMFLSPFDTFPIAGNSFAGSPKAIMDTSGTVQQSNQQEIFEAWENNPLAQAVVDYFTLYPLGTGVQWAVEWEDVNDVLKKFWRVNKLNINQFKFATELSLNGEIFLRFFASPDETGEGIGTVYIRSLDPSTILYIATDPEDVQRVMYYHQRYFASIPPDVMLPYQQFSDDGKYFDWGNVTGYENVVNFEPLRPGESMPVGEVEGWAGGVKPYDPSTGFYAWITRKIPAEQMIHFPINNLSNEKRGRSDLARVVKWVKEYQAFIHGMVRMSKVAQMYVWNVTVKGGKESVQAVADRNRTPPLPGSIKIHGENEDWEAMAPAINVHEFDTVGNSIRNMISAGSKSPAFMLGDSNDTTFAGSNQQFMPVVKAFNMRQEILRQLFIEMFQRVVKIHQNFDDLDKTYPTSQPGDSEVESGKNEIDPSESNFGIQLPEVAEVDMLEKATAISQLARPSNNMPVISDQQAQEIMGLDSREMKAEIASEHKDKVQMQKDMQDALTPAVSDSGAITGTSSGGATGNKTNTIRQGGATPPKPNVNPSRQGRQYPNHQRNPKTN